jgi:hypothetical protein
MLTEHVCHLGVEFRWVAIIILQLDHDVALELVKLCEYGYYRNL